MLYSKGLEEPKLCSLSRKLRGVLVLVCKHHQKQKLLGAKGLECQRKNKNQQPVEVGLKSRGAHSLQKG